MRLSKIVVTTLDGQIRELVLQTNSKTLGIWAADCAERVLPYFEKKYLQDNRPRNAIKALRKWIETGAFRMTDVRRDSLAAHAAARSVENDNVARSAARAAGQAMATAHVPTHSIAAASYAATVIRDFTGSMKETEIERDWQLKHLAELRKGTQI